MIKRVSTVAWTVVLVSLAVELLIGFSTVNNLLHPRPKPPLPPLPTSTAYVPSPTPEGWKLYTSTRLGITLYYPDTWTPLPADSLNQTSLVDAYKGVDGFFELDTASDPNVIDKFCELQAHTHPEYFGSGMSITRKQVANLPACLIVPADSSPSQVRAQLVLQSPWSDPAYNYISLSTDPDHFLQIVNSVGVDQNRVLSSTATPLPVASPIATQFLPTPVFNASKLGDLTLEQYAIVSAHIDTPTHLDFLLRVPSSVFDRRRTVREPDLATQLAQANALINPLGWQLQPTAGSPGTISAFQTGVLRSTDLVSLRPVVVNQSGSGFALYAVDKSGSGWLIQRSGFTTWDAAEHFNVPPVYLGDDLVSLDAVPQDPAKIQVVQGGTVVFTDTMSAAEISHPDVSLGVDGGQWVFDSNGSLFIGGRLVNKSLGYDEIYGWQVLNGKPFYFFTQNGKVGLSYGGSVLPVNFDDVIHGSCCEAGAFNVSGNPSMVWFFARSNDFWNYVELGVFPQ